MKIKRKRLIPGILYTFLVKKNTKLKKSKPIKVVNPTLVEEIKLTYEIQSIFRSNETLKDHAIRNSSL